MKTHYQLNVQINTIVGNLPIEFNNFDEIKKIMRRQHDLIVDEFHELRDDGIGEKNIREIRDGLADVIVTVDGMFHRLGLQYPNVDAFYFEEEPLEECIEIIEAELAKAAEFLEMDQYSDLQDLHMRLSAIYGNVIWAVYQLSWLFGVDVQADQEAIYRSNLSKFDTDYDVARKGVEKYDAMGVPTSLFPNTIDGLTYHVIKCTADTVDGNGKRYGAGKFLKSIYFKEPVLVDLPADAPIHAMFA